MMDIVCHGQILVLVSHSVGGDIRGVNFVGNSETVPCINCLNPIWIDTVYFGMLLSVPV